MQVQFAAFWKGEVTPLCDSPEEAIFAVPPGELCKVLMFPASTHHHSVKNESKSIPGFLLIEDREPNSFFRQVTRKRSLQRAAQQQRKGNRSRIGKSYGALTVIGLKAPYKSATTLRLECKCEGCGSVFTTEYTTIKRKMMRGEHPTCSRNAQCPEWQKAAILRKELRALGKMPPVPSTKNKNKQTC